MSSEPKNEPPDHGMAMSHPFGYHEARQEEVAAELGVSRARVSFLERQALQKLRRALETRRALGEMLDGGFGL
jgi:predicted XRE-type DNA-binding protein